MQALRKTHAAAGVELVDIQPPAPAGPEVIVRVRATGICGSDLHVDDWTSSYGFIAPALPVTLGHEFVGVAENGPLAGQRVVVRPSVTCGVCAACIAGRHAQLVVSGYDDAARFDALRQMGFEQLADVAGDTLAERTATCTDGLPFDVVFEATGVPDTISEALALLRRDGIVVVTGIHARPLALDLTALVRRQQQLRGSFRPPESDWPRALELMRELGPAMRPMVSHVLPLSRALEGFALAHDKQASKVLLRPGDDDA